MKPEDRPTTFNILFVCSGNTCRSPMAEAIARRSLERRGWGGHVRVDSAGTSAAWDFPASEGAEAAMAEIGLDLTGHRSQPLTAELVDSMDVVLAMTPGHQRVVEEFGGAGKVSLLTDYLEGEAVGSAIEDPIGGTPAEYAATRDRIARAIEALLDRLSTILSP